MNSVSPNDKSVVLRKPAGMTHFHNIYTLTERKLINISMDNSRKHGLTDRIYEMDIPDEVEPWLTTGTTNNTEWLKDSAKGLLSKIAEWNSLGKDNAQEWEATQLMSYCKIKGRKFCYAFNKHALKKIKNPQLYGSMFLAAQAKMKHTASLVLYEFLSTEFSIAKAKTVKLQEINLAQLRKILGLEADAYVAWDDLKKLLEKILVEINAHTHLSVKYDKYKSGRKVAGVHFEIERNGSFQESLPGLKEGLERAALDPAEQKGLDELLKENGVSCKVRKELLANCNAEQIRRNVEYARKKYAGGEATNLSGFTVWAIRGDEAPRPKVAQQAGEASGVGSDVRTLDEDHEKGQEFAEYQDAVVDAFLVEKGDVWLKASQENFEEEQILGQDLIEGAWRSEGWASPFVKSAFRNWVSEQALTAPHQKDFEKFCVWRAEETAAASDKG